MTIKENLPGTFATSVTRSYQVGDEGEQQEIFPQVTECIERMLHSTAFPNSDHRDSVDRSNSVYGRYKKRHYLIRVEDSSERVATDGLPQEVIMGEIRVWVAGPDNKAKVDGRLARKIDKALEQLPQKKIDPGI